MKHADKRKSTLCVHFVQEDRTSNKVHSCISREDETHEDIGVDGI